MLLGCTPPKAQKINGLSFVAANEALIPEQVVPVTQMNANWVAIMPFGFMENLAATEIIFDTDRQWFGETAAGAKQYIGLLKEKGIQVMLKPQNMDLAGRVYREIGDEVGGRLEKAGSFLFEVHPFLCPVGPIGKLAAVLYRDRTGTFS